MAAASDISSATVPLRQPLPTRRPQTTEEIDLDGRLYTLSIGFDPIAGEAREVFLVGAKEGTQLAAMLDDISVVISVALQHGVPAAALAKSVSRLPAHPLAPPYMDTPQPAAGGHGPAASIIGAVIDRVAELQEANTRRTAARAAAATAAEAAE